MFVYFVYVMGCIDVCVLCDVICVHVWIEVSAGREWLN